MIVQGTGDAVVNISSTASRLARPGIAHYGASKAGLYQLTSVMAVELTGGALFVAVGVKPPADVVKMPRRRRKGGKSGPLHRWEG